MEPPAASYLLHLGSKQCNCARTNSVVGECVGDLCYTDTQCYDHSCTHPFSAFKKSTETWHDHFELRETKDRGIGVFTKTAFKTDDVLGWYAGEVLSSDACDNHGDYLMEMPIGETLSSPPESPCTSASKYAPSCPSLSSETPSSALTHETSAADMTVFIDASRGGNWTRFINHSCKPYTEFRMLRVSAVRIMVVEAARYISEGGVELTVDYGRCYYGVGTRRRCRCSVRGCVSARRRRRLIWSE
ncbi:hypothetical protein BKA63DRAFT_414613 [Paraphoma chrysanthemicola]|nr:hypothetical protein BKA63DRAFT_414613 [Paraphoma chrysanthemicola]